MKKEVIKNLGVLNEVDIRAYEQQQKLSKLVDDILKLIDIDFRSYEEQEKLIELLVLMIEQQNSIISNINYIYKEIMSDLKYIKEGE